MNEYMHTNASCSQRVHKQPQIGWPGPKRKQTLPLQSLHGSVTERAAHCLRHIIPNTCKCGTSSPIHANAANPLYADAGGLAITSHWKSPRKGALLAALSPFPAAPMPSPNAGRQAASVRRSHTNPEATHSFGQEPHTAVDRPALVLVRHRLLGISR